VAEKKKSRVNEAGNYTKPALRKRLFNSIKASGKGGKPGQWSARKAQMLAKRYKESGVTKTNASQEVAKVAEEVDKARMGNQVRQTIDTRKESDR
jgi:hypothetical protein